MTTWKAHEERPLTTESLIALFNNDIPVVRIKEFATPAECAAFARSAKQGNVKFYSVEKRIGYIGQAQYEYRWGRPKADYFAAVRAANIDLAQVIAGTFDPVQRLIGILRRVYPHAIAIAREPEFGDYFAGVIRLASEGVDLHADFAPFNTLDYCISAIDAQLGWNFFAQELLEGGQTTVYNAPWTPELIPGAIPQSYNLPRGIVDGAASFTYAPTAGDVVLFNTRNPHEVGAGVARPGGDRVSIGSFIGRMPDRSLGLWA